ncbi:MAG: hypothetical protein ACPG4X_21555 [Pikeienuella sp.]
MTLNEIQKEIDQLCKMASDKGVVRAEVKFWLEANGNMKCSVWGNHPDIDGGLEQFDGDNADELLAQVCGVIRDLCSPEEIETREFLKKVSDAIDYGHEHSLDDKYVAPLRGVTKAMTDNLLTKET